MIWAITIILLIISYFSIGIPAIIIILYIIIVPFLFLFSAPVRRVNSRVPTSEVHYGLIFFKEDNRQISTGSKVI
jgi:hypothetical protein